jgi:putative tryptophan/tyrosine transport system substrate-binding protein
MNKKLLIRAIIVALVFAGIGGAFFYGKKKTPKIYHVGVLSSFSAMSDITDGFKAGMKELGYVEGKNIVYDLQTKDNDPEGEKRAVEKFINDKVDVIFTFPTGASVTAYTLTNGTKIPVIFDMCGVEGNISVESVSHPGGNITGVRFPGPDNVVKHLELMLELKPQTKKIFTAYDPNYPNTPIMVNALRSAALSKGITIMEAPNTTLEGVKADLQKLVVEKNIPDAILLLPEGFSSSPDVSEVMIKFANDHHIPIGAGMPYMLDLGTVFTLIPDDVEMGKLAAPIADKIFHGTPAGEIPLVTPNNHLWLNYKVAKELGLNINEGLLGSAEHIIR